MLWFRQLLLLVGHAGLGTLGLMCLLSFYLLFLFYLPERSVALGRSEVEALLSEEIRENIFKMK